MFVLFNSVCAVLEEYVREIFNLFANDDHSMLQFCSNFVNGSLLAMLLHFLLLLLML